MSALAFDTHKAVTALKQAGFAEPQAEAVVTTMGEALGGNVATKADLAAVEAKLEAVEAKLEADIAAVQAKLEADIAAVRTEIAQEFKALYKQLWVMAVGIVGLTVTLVKLIP